MARRSRASTAEDLMDLVALLPWWAGISLALLSYFILHAVASAPLVLSGARQDVGQLVTSSLWRGLAYAGQFILPFICAIGALASALHRRSRRALVDSATKSKAADALEEMTWRQFELLVGEGFRRQGYTVSETGGGGADGGIDLVLGKGGERFFVQCKQWKAFKVGVTVVRELYGVMAAGGATGGFVVTSGRFTQEAVTFASGRNIQLIDGQALLELIRDGRTARRSEGTHRARPLASDAAPLSDTPSCPLCTGSMVRRIARRGSSVGNSFWGCSTYPSCGGTRPV
ncbi:restriction system protein [Variovorax beijingensis]|uniref:Restriction system protein n=1 Tax=Variovorax beijingensis TaxID=2496117 RepID=A0A561B3P7_9BURK|nr:restriction endonuclease [Variovorax beijingensis]TWD73498.1 restriction system protein [Variovorax beijingensis]